MMSESSRDYRFPDKHFWLILLLFSGFLRVDPAQAGDRFFKRYYRDQAKESVVVGPTVRRGTLRDGKVYLGEGEAVEMALRQNLDINVLRHTPIIRAWDSRNLESVYDPSTTFGLNWDRATTPTTSVLAGGDSVTDVFTGYDFGFRKQFSTGTSIEAGFLGSRNRTTNFFSSLVPAINTALEVTFRQNLLEGFGRIASEYEIEISRNNLDISEEDFKQSLMDIVLLVQEAYWELQFALEDIKVKEKALEAALTVEQQNQARFEVGTGSRLEVVEAQAEAASRREELIRAQFTYRRIQDGIVKLITSYEDPREFQAELVPSDSVSTPAAVTESFERLTAVAAEQRPEFQKADLEVANRRIQLDLSRDRLKPSLDLILGYRQYGLGGNLVVRDYSQGFIDAPLVRIEPGGVGDSLGQLFSGDFYGYTLGFNLELPILNQQARADNAQALIALDQSELQRRSVKQTIALEIRDALTQIEMNEARLEASEAAVALARERWEGEEARFEVGMGTTRLVIESQRDLIQAQSVFLRSQVDLIISHARLDRAVGRNLEKFNIRLADAVRMNVR